MRRCVLMFLAYMLPYFETLLKPCPGPCFGALHLSDAISCSHWRCRQNQATVSVQAARVSADAVAAAVTLTNDCIKDGNAVEATSKAAASAWRSSQVSGLSPSITPHALHAVERSEIGLHVHNLISVHHIAALVSGQFDVKKCLPPVTLLSRGQSVGVACKVPQSCLSPVRLLLRGFPWHAGRLSCVCSGGKRDRCRQERLRGQHRQRPRCRRQCSAVLQPGASPYSNPQICPLFTVLPLLC